MTRIRQLTQNTGLQDLLYLCARMRAARPAKFQYGSVRNRDAGLSVLHTRMNVVLP